MEKLLATDTDRRVAADRVSAVMNAAKLELALAIAVCIVVALLTVSLSLSRAVELAVLALTAVASAAWVVLRTRQVVQRMAAAALKEEGDGPQQEQ